MAATEGGRYGARSVTKSDLKAVEDRENQKINDLAQKIEKNTVSSSKVTMVVGLLGALLTATLATRYELSNVRQHVEDNIKDMERERINPLETEITTHAATANQRLQQLEKDRDELKRDLDEAEKEIRRLQRYHGIRPAIQRTDDEE